MQKLILEWCENNLGPIRLGNVGLLSTMLLPTSLNSRGPPSGTCVGQLGRPHELKGLLVPEPTLQKHNGNGGVESKAHSQREGDWAGECAIDGCKLILSFSSVCVYIFV